MLLIGQQMAVVPVGWERSRLFAPPVLVVPQWPNEAISQTSHG